MSFMKAPKFCEEIKNIYRLKIPFDTVYTSVFLITSPPRAILVDCGTTAEDVKEYIVPALKKMGYDLSCVPMIVLTHGHGDHAGGLAEILKFAPNIEVVRSVREISDGIYTYPMPGHTEDCIGVLDTRSHTLISGDGLQGAGVDKYRCYTENPSKYLDTLSRVRNDGEIENVLFSHAYEPWNSGRAIGRGEVNTCLDECLKYVKTDKK